MYQILLNWLLSAVAILVTAYLLPGVAVSGFGSALGVALVLGVLNAFIKPFLIFLTLPINVLTLGLFTLVINAFLIWVTSGIVPGFVVSSFAAALVFGIILSLVIFLSHLVF